MRYTHLFGKTSKTVPADADSTNARLLVQGGYVDQLMAGVYTYMPLGLRVLDRIKAVIREEMNAIGGQELLMPALQPKEPWATTGRWDDPGPEVMFRVAGRSDKEYGLGWTHEEIVTPLAKKFIRSYKDLPFAVYQIQDKFRNEPRAKSGLLRGREFSMKDLYSFHASEADLDAFYASATQAYRNVFSRCGLDAMLTEASGGAFSQYSHEFQVATESGEDVVYWCDTCKVARNKELGEANDGDACAREGCSGTVVVKKAIEVGNIFRLMTKFTGAFDAKFTDAEGKEQTVLMGCYGIGPSRVMGAIAEIHSDEKGLRWPKAVAPYAVHLVPLYAKDEVTNAKVNETIASLERGLTTAGYEPLIDDRADARAGEKFADADLLGMPVRIVVSAKTLEQGMVEWKARGDAEARMVDLGHAIEEVIEFMCA
jgi:prolyl-tRNA synthetase